jgi:hypothetical protein
MVDMSQHLAKLKAMSQKAMETMMGPPQQDPPTWELPLTQPAVSGQNGRVNFTNAPSAGGPAPPAEFAYNQTPDALASYDLLRGNWEETPVSTAFFSVANMAFLQKEIIRQVYEKSGGKWTIDPQDIDELKIVMRAQFYQYGKNLPTDIKGQVDELNGIVLGWCVPKIMTEVQAHIYYINDIDKLPVPMSRPVLLSKAGTKSLPFTNFM